MSDLNHEALAAAVGTSMPLLNWVLNHLGDAPELSADIQGMVAAQTVPDRWAAFKPIGDMVFGKWAADFPGAAAVTAAPATPAQMADLIQARLDKPDPHGIYAKIGDGTIAAGLSNLLKVVIPYLPLILSLFGVPVPATLPAGAQAPAEEAPDGT